MAISEVLGIRPWEQRDLLTVGDLDQAVAYLEAKAKAEKDGR